MRLENYEQAVYSFNTMKQEDITNSITGEVPDSFDSPSASRQKRAAPQTISAALQCSSAPTLKNWVTDGKVTPVQSQGNCQSCYIFAALSALESVIAIKYNRAPVKLSEQQLLECIRVAPYGGCNRGASEWVWDSSRTDNGIVASASYKAYNEIDSAGCSKGIAKSPNTIVSSYIKNPYADEATLKCSLAKNGPHVVSMDFSGLIQSYKSGIFDDSNNECNSALDSTGKMIKPSNHAVTLVGYGTELNQKGVMTDYWLIKNSWGSTWGLNGYIKVARNMKNICHIATNARYPVIV